MAKRDEVVVPIDLQVVRRYCRQHKAPEYSGLTAYVSKQHSCYVAVPGRGMVNLLDFSKADEDAFAGVSFDDFMAYCLEFRARMYAQSRRLRLLGLITPKGAVAIPGTRRLYSIATLSEAEMTSLEQASDQQVARAYAAITRIRRVIRPLQTAVTTTRSRRDRAIGIFMPAPNPTWRYPVTTLI